MLNRRRFMQFTALSVALPTDASARQMPLTDPLPPNVRVLSSAGLTDCVAFTNALPGACEMLGSDPGEIVQDLCSSPSLQGTAVLMGLTRNSDFMLLSQIAMENGMRLVFHGEHRYGQGRVQHRLSGSVKTAAT